MGAARKLAIVGTAAVLFGIIAYQARHRYRPHPQIQSVRQQQASEHPDPIGTRASLTEEQKQYLARTIKQIKTRNSFADLGRLKESLARWDELVPEMVPTNMTPVVPFVKQAIIERVAELEKEAGQDRKP